MLHFFKFFKLGRYLATAQLSRAIGESAFGEADALRQMAYVGCRHPDEGVWPPVSLQSSYWIELWLGEREIMNIYSTGYEEYAQLHS